MTAVIVIFKLVLIYLIIQTLIVSKKKLGLKGTFFILFIISAGAGISGLLAPFFDSRIIILILIPAVHCAVLFFPSGWEKGFNSFISGKIFSLLVIVSLSFIIPFGAAELVVGQLIDSGLVEAYSLIRTVPPKGTADFRMIHITSDVYREPDPILLWKPVARYPYTEQRFKGPVVKVPKPSNVYRIMTYGDSNTDGPERGGWPEQLQKILMQKNKANGIQYEVLNAGVAGYSSYQGLQRCRQEVNVYKPDVITVSFGWNDLPTALGKPDKSFFDEQKIYKYKILSILYKYKFILAIKNIVSKFVHVHIPPDAGPRVPIEDYIDNMRNFYKISRDNGTTVIFLTRPHRLKAEEMLKLNAASSNRVPLYNKALVDFSKSHKALFLDVQQIFEKRFRYLFSDECHFTPEGHQQMAILVHDLLVEKKLIK